MPEAGEREADYVEVAAFDTGNKTAGATLDGVRASFVKGLLGRKVFADLLFGEGREVDESGFDKAAAL
jgi:hypothetical protein